MAQNVFLKEPAATKVQIVNKDGSEVILKAEVENLPLSAGSVKVTLTGNAASIGLLWRPATGNYNICLDNILLLQGDGTLVPVPLNTLQYNITAANLDALLASYKTAYSTLVSGITAATLHYSLLASTGVVTSEVYDLKSVSE